jgi:hypothetical protein
MTINLEEDLYRLAKSVAIADDCSISLAVNKLLRRYVEANVGTTRGPDLSEFRLEGRRRFPVTLRTRTFTSDDVRRIELETDPSQAP